MKQPSSDIWAIVPVKTLHESKTRLANILSPVQRAELMTMFLQRTLSLLRSTERIAHTLVVSSDPQVLKTAAQYDAAVLKEGDERGLNVAVSRAIQLATANRAASALVLPADLPLVTLEDIESMLSTSLEHRLKLRPGSPSITICADRRNEGTNALLIPLPTQFSFQFGPGSFQRHLQEAERLGLHAVVCSSSCLAFDLDTEDDWSKYQQVASDRTHALHTLHCAPCI